LYGPLINSHRFSYALGIASSFAAAGLIISHQITDTLNINLHDHWYPVSEQEDVQNEQQSKRMSLAKKYFSVEV